MCRRHGLGLGHERRTTAEQPAVRPHRACGQQGLRAGVWATSGHHVTALRFGNRGTGHLHRRRRRPYDHPQVLHTAVRGSQSSAAAPNLRRHLTAGTLHCNVPARGTSTTPPPRVFAPCNRPGPVFTLVGVAQPIGPCGTTDYPGVFLRVAAMLPWINATVGVPVNTPALLWKGRTNSRVLYARSRGTTPLPLPAPSLARWQVVMQIDPNLNPSTSPCCRCVALAGVGASPSFDQATTRGVQWSIEQRQHRS